MKKRMLAVVLFVLALANIASASSNTLREDKITERIQKLRERLEEFQRNRHKNKLRKPQKEIIELTLEKISSKLENRKDVKVITLFHDPEFSTEAKPERTESQAVKLNKLNNEMWATASNAKRRAERIREMIASIRSYN